MRKDMSKLITECYRYGGQYKYRNRRHQLRQQLQSAIRNDDYDSVDTGGESMRGWVRGWDARKEFGENLNPLIRFMLSKVGQRWDDVYSEMSACINRNSAQQLHIWQHAEDYVETNTFIGDDGEVWYNDGFGFGGAVRRISSSHAFVYACPETGVLKKISKEPRRRYSGPNCQNAPETCSVVVNKHWQCHNIWGDWYLIHIKPIPQPAYRYWSEEEKIKFAEELDGYEPARKWPKPSANAIKFNHGHSGKWIYPEYEDVAGEDIIATREGFFDGSAHDRRRRLCARDRWGYKDWLRNNYASLYGRPGVYAAFRKQMNTAELKRFGLKK